MPHQCTECGRTFPDGSKEMLSGCPDCGGNKFQFDPSGDTDTDAPDPDASPPDRPGGVADRVGRATAAVKGWMSSSDDGEATESAGSPSSGTADAGNATNAVDTANASDSADAGNAPDAPGSTGTAADGANTTGSAADGANTTGSAADGANTTDDDRAYGEWPNPDGADTSGVGKGPEDRVDPEERPDAGATESATGDAATIDGDTATGDDSTADDATAADASVDVEGPTRPDRSSIDATEASDEDTAQATARSDVVSPDELPDDPPDSGTLGPRGGVPGGTSGGGPRERPGAAGDAAAPNTADGAASNPNPDSDSAPAPEDARVASEPAEDRPDLEDLREELNDQFESIRIVEPGQYELNLMELYDREEYIISLQEDGRYVIEVPERWRDDEE